MELVPCTEDDAWLTVALETDPRVMAELGGAWTAEEATATHARRLRNVADNSSWWLKIVPEPGGAGVGTMMLWSSEPEGEPVSEAGWMVLPEHQGRGYASAALGLLIERAQADGLWGDIHAYPGATNAPSNALCRKFSFELVGQMTVDYAGRLLECNHWVLRAP
jgi:RimJ/RimL family protein N-acetyltransferase